MLWCSRDRCPGCVPDEDEVIPASPNPFPIGSIPGDPGYDDGDFVVSDPTEDALADAEEHIVRAQGLLFRLFPELNDDAEEARLPREALELRSALSEAEAAVQAVLRAVRGRP